jgi:predicted nucleic acid-binding protein
MTRYAVDAPTLLRIAQSGSGLRDGHQLVAPRSVRTDALQLLLDDVRAGALPEDDALALHERITELKIRALGDRVSRSVAWRFAREHDWLDLPAAEYLAVAHLQADVLVTADPDLARAAEGVVPMGDLGDLADLLSDA